MNSPRSTDLLPPIPTPRGHYWQLFRQTLMPSVVLLVVAVIIIVVWQRVAQPASFPGEVETIQTLVNSPDNGLLTNLWVTTLQEVKAGDLVGEVMTTDPRTANTRLQVMRSRMSLIELEMNPILDRQRGALEYERLSVSCAQIRVELATARVNQQRAINELKRNEELYKQKLLSEDLYDLSLKTKESLDVEVAEKEKIVASTEKMLERLAYMSDSFVPGGENDPLKQALALEEEKARVFEQKMKPVQMFAPIDGTVTQIHRHAGEQIMAGEPLITITAPQAERIVAYLPYGYRLTPKVGMQVEVRTRPTSSLLRQVSLAQITGVGPHVQPITNTLGGALSVRPAVLPIGRPIAISMPADLKLLPGEPVDLALLPEREASREAGRRVTEEGK